MSSYEEFLSTKLAHHVSTGTGMPTVGGLGDHLFPFQRDLVTWALKRGRSAIFAATGLGKTRMQLVWADQIARYTGKPVLILAPLAVAQQTVNEARSLGIDACVAREAFGVAPLGITVTNYERHICPLQLQVIERCVELWSRKDDVVWSPFMGIGSEGYVALRNGRRFVGAELKTSYYEQAVRNLHEAATVKQASLFGEAV